MSHSYLDRQAQRRKHPRKVHYELSWQKKDGTWWIMSDLNFEAATHYAFLIKQDGGKKLLTRKYQMVQSDWVF